MVSVRSRSGLIAGALFVSPLAAAAFRVPSSAAHSNFHFHPSASSRRRRHSDRPQVNASVLSDSDEQQQTPLAGNVKISDAASDIIGKAIEQQNSRATATGVVDGADRQRRKNQYKQRHQRNVHKSRKNNTAMTDPDFLRKRTEALLRTTEGSYNYRGNLCLGGNLRVDKRTFNWLIDAWSYAGVDDATDHALAILSRMEELRGADDGPSNLTPDAKSYTKVINVIARSGRKDAGEKAERLLRRMTRDGDEDLRPTALTYTYVIDAHARSPSPRAPHAAQRLVEEMERLRAEGDPDVRPTTRAWNSVISAWAQWKGEEMVSPLFLACSSRRPFASFVLVCARLARPREILSALLPLRAANERCSACQAKGTSIVCFTIIFSGGVHYRRQHRPTLATGA